MAWCSSCFLGFYQNNVGTFVCLFFCIVHVRREMINKQWVAGFLFFRDLFVPWGDWRERKRKRAGLDGKGREKRGFFLPFPSSHRPPRTFPAVASMRRREVEVIPDFPFQWVWLTNSPFRTRNCQMSRPGYEGISFLKLSLSDSSYS